VEDVAFWPPLLARADEAGARADRDTLEAMEAEHALVDPALASTSSAFEAMQSHPCVDHRNALDVRITALRQALADHLRHEETEGLPLVQRTMTRPEWDAAERAAAKGYPTRLVPFLVPWVADDLPRDALHRLLRDVGPVYGLVLRVFRPRYEAKERAAFRYAG
jgi:hypothetical protein